MLRGKWGSRQLMWTSARSVPTGPLASALAISLGIMRRSQSTTTAVRVRDLARYHYCVRGPIRNEAPGNAVLDGGPLDGREHRVESDTTELLVVMEDGARHIYVACQRVQALPDGRVVPVFEYRGRNYPLRSSGTGAA